MANPGGLISFNVQVGYIPIPRVEYTDDDFDIVIENLTLQGRNMFPTIMSMEAYNFFKFSPYQKIEDLRHHEFTITLEQIQADMRDVAFYYRRKTGAIKLKDSGMADILLGGQGLTITIHLVSSDNDPSSVFKVKDVQVKVDTLKFNVRDASHELLYKILKFVVSGVVKRQIQKAVGDAVRTGLEYLDGQLVTVRNRMDEAKQSENMTRRQALQDVSIPEFFRRPSSSQDSQLFKRKKEEAGSVKTSESKAHFKVVHNKRASMIDAGHPSGWVNRTTEREEKATLGKEWRSEA